MAVIKGSASATRMTRRRSEVLGALACIDFGTAFSKAAIHVAGQGIVPLELGRVAGDPTAANRFVANSSLFVAKDRTVHFGHHAIEKWARQRPMEIQRIDSMKRWLLEGNESIEGEPVDERFLPTGCVLTKGEALSLLIAYVTDLACTALDSRAIGRDVDRRDSGPVLEDRLGKRVDRQLRELLCRGHLIAEELQGQWERGIPLERAKELVAMATESEHPDWLVEERRVLEPVAAGHAALHRDSQHRSLALVVDVGAGTTDVAAFAAVQGEGATTLDRAIPIGTPKALAMGGDFLDAVLLDHVWEGLSRRDRTDVARLQAEGQARSWKEQLFKAGRVAPTLSGGVRGAVLEREAFLGLAEVRRFENELERVVKEVLDSNKNLIAMWSRSPAHPLESILLVPTGGGARLPMVQSLAQHTRILAHRRFPIEWTDRVPDDFLRSVRNPSEVFPRVAVALGGASPDYPEKDQMVAPSTIRLGPM